MTGRIDLSGQRFGLLTAVKVDSVVHREACWLCQCDCGHSKVVRGRDLRNGLTRSCGCASSALRSESNTTHGESGSKAYKVWTSMKQRCMNPNSQNWKDYGARGIGVCERWMSFENFLADMGHPPEGLTLERNDVDGNYELANCRWASWSEQAANKRNSMES